MLKRWKADTWEQQLKLRSFSPRWSCWVGDDMKTPPRRPVKTMAKGRKHQFSTSKRLRQQDIRVPGMMRYCWSIWSYGSACSVRIKIHQHNHELFLGTKLGQLKKGGYIRNNLRGCNGGQSQVERPCGHSTKSIFGGDTGDNGTGLHWDPNHPAKICQLGQMAISQRSGHCMFWIWKLRWAGNGW